MKIILHFMLVVFSIVVFPMLLSSQVNNLPQMMHVNGPKGHPLETQYFYNAIGVLKARGLETYTRNIGGDGIVTAHITVGELSQDAQFAVKYSYRYALAVYFGVTTVHLNSAYSVIETFPGTTSDTLIYRVSATQLIPSPPFYYLWNASIPYKIDSVVSTCLDSTTTGIQNAFTHLPVEFILRQNYPNPFNPKTIIEYSLPKDAHAKLIVYDVLGNLIKILIDEEKSHGSYKVEFDATNLSSGVYLYQLQASEFTQTKKLLLMK